MLLGQATESTIRWGGRVLVLLTIVSEEKCHDNGGQILEACVCSCEGKIRNKRSSSISFEKIVK
jgi:hypothetical protein